MALRITILCDACPASIPDIPPGEMTRTLKSQGWTSREAKGRTQDYCPECRDEAEMTKGAAQCA